MKYKTEKLRIDKYLGNMGVGSRSEIKRYIKNKRVMVNGVYITDNGLLINLDDDIKFDEQSVIYKKFIYIMMNKPQGVISATEDKHQETVIDLLDEKYLHYEMFPTGRLDKDTEGLLLLTNNGTLAHNMLSPKKHVEKKYYVEIHGDLKEKDIKSKYLARGNAMEESAIERVANYYGCDLEKNDLPFNYIEGVGKYVLFNIYCATQKESKKAKEILDTNKAKYFVSESKVL